jgi:hypothetical protein
MLAGTVRLERSLGFYRLHGANSWANSGYFGSGSQIGLEDPNVATAIQQELIRTYCAAAPRLGRILDTKQLARALVNYVGWPQAIRLHDHNTNARMLLSEWVKPRRRIATWLSMALPRALRPRRIVIKRRKFSVKAAEEARERDTDKANLLGAKYVRSIYGPYLLDTPQSRFPVSRHRRQLRRLQPVRGGSAPLPQGDRHRAGARDFRAARGEHRL